MNREMFASSKIKVKIKLWKSPYSDITKLETTAFRVSLDVHDTDFLFFCVSKQCELSAKLNVFIMAFYVS